MNQWERIYLEGKQAKEAGLERFSCFAKIKQNTYWYAGYDGIEFSEIENPESLKADLLYSRIGLYNT